MTKCSGAGKIINFGAKYFSEWKFHSCHGSGTKLVTTSRLTPRAFLSRRTKVPSREYGCNDPQNLLKKYLVWLTWSPDGTFDQYKFLLFGQISIRKQSIENRYILFIHSSMPLCMWYFLKCFAWTLSVQVLLLLYF